VPSETDVYSLTIMWLNFFLMNEKLSLTKQMNTLQGKAIVKH
jgi:hypothetical protein